MSGGTRVRRWQSARRLWLDTWRLQLPLCNCCRLVLPYHVVQHATDEHISNDPSQAEGGGGTTTSNHPNTPSTRVYYWVSATRMKTKIDDDQSQMAQKFTLIWCSVSSFKNSKFMPPPHDLECSLQGQRKKNHINVIRVF